MTIVLTCSLQGLCTRWCCHHDWLWDGTLTPGWGRDWAGGPGPCYVLLTPDQPQPMPNVTSTRSATKSLTKIFCVWHPLEESICCLQLSLLFTRWPRAAKTLFMMTSWWRHSPCHDTPGASLCHYPTFSADLRVSGCDAVHRLHWNCGWVSNIYRASD